MKKVFCAGSFKGQCELLRSVSVSYKTHVQECSHVTLQQEEVPIVRPYSEVPGPKPIPILGNTWRFFPIIGKRFNFRMCDTCRWYEIIDYLLSESAKSSPEQNLGIF